MIIMKKKNRGKVIFLKTNKVKRGKRVIFQQNYKKCYLYNLIVILGHASKSP